MSNNNLPEKMPNFVIFQTETGKINIEVFFHNDTLWLSQKKIAELFEKKRSVITKHLKNIFSEGEQDEKVVCAKFAHTTQHSAIEGKNRKKRCFTTTCGQFLQLVTGSILNAPLNSKSGQQKYFMNTLSRAL